VLQGVSRLEYDTYKLSVTWKLTMCYWVSVAWNVTLLLGVSHLESDSLLLGVSHLDCDTVQLAVSLGISKALLSPTHQKLHIQRQQSIPEYLSV